MEELQSQRYAKRQRLGTACAQCRKRKVRCDEGQPKCRNCVKRGDECVTYDVKDPDQLRARLPNSLAKIRSIDLEESENGSPLNRKDISPSQACSGSRSNRSDPFINRPTAMTVSSRDERSLSANTDNSAQGEHHDELGSYDRTTILNTDHPSYRRKFIGGGTLQALAKRLDFYFEQKGLLSIESRFPFGMQHAEEMPLPGIRSGLLLPELPTGSALSSLLTLFKERIYPFYPILDWIHLETEARRLSSMDTSSIPNHDVTLLCSIYSVLAMAEDEKNGNYSTAGWEFLVGAYGLLAYLTSLPYLSSVQATLLLSIALKARNKDGCARQTLGQAIRIAQSIGIHRRIDGMANTPGYNNLEVHQNLDSQIWWTCYCMEMCMSLETGRPTAVRDTDCTQILPVEQLDGRRGNHLLASLTGLAKIQSRFIDIFYHRSQPNRNSSSLLRDIGLADQDLCEWAASVGENFRPDLDLCCETEDLHLATFLSMMYHQTMISIHQISLMIDSEIYQRIVVQNCGESKHRSRLLGSEKIVLSSARKIAALQIDLLDHGFRSQIIPMTPILLAIVVLALKVIKNPNITRNRSDIAILGPLSHFAEARYAAAGQRPEFIQAIVILRSQIESGILNTGMISSNSFPNNYVPDGDRSSAGETSPQWTGDLFSSIHAPLSAVNHDEQMNSYLQSDYPWDWIMSDGTGTNTADEMRWDTSSH